MDNQSPINQNDSENLAEVGCYKQEISIQQYTSAEFDTGFFLFAEPVLCCDCNTENPQLTLIPCGHKICIDCFYKKLLQDHQNLFCQLDKDVIVQVVDSYGVCWLHSNCDQTNF